MQSEKLASVGRVAATIAHEINNPLAAVMNTLFLARSSEDAPVLVKQYLDIADEELKRVSLITHQALGFYRDSTAPAMVSISAILDSAMDLLQSRIKAKGATIEKQYEPGLQLTAVAGELRQVFSNLLANSLDAIGDNGIIKLRARTSRLPNDGRGHIRITVADNGTGIDRAVRARIFEALFTTKDAIGTGLGLWVSKQIVEKHSGSIRLRSSTQGLRRGTVFSIVLPLESDSREPGVLSNRVIE
jgi:signal transduction histidine kinase